MRQHEIGSDFETVADEWTHQSGQDEVPWRHADERIVYLESGRQALTLISRQLRAQGYEDLYVPAHYCVSMIHPFREIGWRLHPVRVLDNWTLDPSCLRGGNGMERSAVLSVPFFGVAESASWLHELGEMSKRGALIMSDETHRIWTPGLHIAHFRMASLRKLLPLPDGAYVMGDVPVNGGPESASAEQRLAAMRSKDAYLAGMREAAHRAEFLLAERSLEERVEPSSMSSHSAQLITHLDYTRMARRRSANHDVLAADWPRAAGTVTTRGAAVPSHCVVRHSDVPSLRLFLIENAIYPAVHWPEPPVDWPRLGAWKSTHLSLPIDHRYNRQDMDRTIEVVARYAKRGRKG